MKSNKNNKRRSFIKKSAAGVAASIIIPGYACGSTKSKLKPMKETIGHGDFTYTVDKNWGVQDPSKIPVKRYKSKFTKIITRQRPKIIYDSILEGLIFDTNSCF